MHNLNLELLHKPSNLPLFTRDKQKNYNSFLLTKLKVFVDKAVVSNEDGKSMQQTYDKMTL